MMHVKAYLGTALSFLVIDALWIALVVRRFYENQVGELLRDPPRFAPAALFYLAYAGGLVALAVLPALRGNSERIALLNGALVGAIAYGTFTITNYSVLRGWTLGLVVTDIAWGIFISALCSYCGFLAARPRIRRSS